MVKFKFFVHCVGWAAGGYENTHFANSAKEAGGHPHISTNLHNFPSHRYMGSRNSGKDSLGLLIRVFSSIG